MRCRLVTRDIPAQAHIRDFAHLNLKTTVEAVWGDQELEPGYCVLLELAGTPLPAQDLPVRVPSGAAVVRAPEAPQPPPKPPRRLTLEQRAELSRKATAQWAARKAARAAAPSA